MSTDERARLRRLAQYIMTGVELKARDEEDWPLPYPSLFHSDALAAIALWSLLGEPECLLCGAERDKESLACNGTRYFRGAARTCLRKTREHNHRVPKHVNAGSVLCSRCRNYPTGRRG